jgi:hypothetical protein
VCRRLANSIIFPFYKKQITSMHIKIWKLLLLSLFAMTLTRCALFKPVEEGPGKTGSSIGSAEERLRMDIVDYALQFVGTDYKYAGSNPRTGFDCSGFTSYVLSNFDVSLPRSSEDQENQGRKVRIDEVKPGDLIFYRRSPHGRVFHVSLVVANDSGGITVIHSVSRGVVVENVSQSSYWAPKISTARDVLRF